jgi:hypothetical protein
MPQPHDEPFSESALESPEYRARLMGKLNCLIAVLEVACEKVRLALGSPAAEVERLGRIHKNLRDTLEVCHRARRALQRREQHPAEIDAERAKSRGADARRSRTRARKSPAWQVEMTSPAETARFRKLPPIDRAALREVDLDELIRLLQA